MTAGTRRRGALEHEVLGCLAAAGRPLTVAEVQADLGADLAYTTVLTALSRLHAKGALIRESAGRRYAYAVPADPTAMDARMTARRMARVLESGEDRAGVLARFVADLTPADERLLGELLAAGREERSSRP
jgi:predicted transcriptional regulator